MKNKRHEVPEEIKDFLEANKGRRFLSKSSEGREVWDVISFIHIDSGKFYEIGEVGEGRAFRVGIRNERLGTVDWEDKERNKKFEKEFRLRNASGRIASWGRCNSVSKQDLSRLYCV